MGVKRYLKPNNKTFVSTLKKCVKLIFHKGSTYTKTHKHIDIAEQQINLFKKYGFITSTNYDYSFENKTSPLGHIVVTDKSTFYDVNMLTLESKSDSTSFLSIFNSSKANSRVIKPIGSETKLEALEEFLNNLIYIVNPDKAKAMYKQQSNTKTY